MWFPLPWLIWSAVGAAALALPARAAAPDYAQARNWVCRPGKEAACTQGLDAVVVGANGARLRQVFAPEADPPIDCFYVYPTVSNEPQRYADLALSPEIASAARTQAGRLASRCRLFAPIYRQLTGAGLAAVLAAHAAPDWRGPYADVLAAWRWYLAHANRGRGVVLIGHSQGAILLQMLLARQIDGQPDQHLLVAAFLAGDLALPVPRHAAAGGLLTHIPLCTEAAQTGCVYVWASYLANDTVADRVFGRNPAAPLVAACASPAAPGGGRGMLQPYFAKSAAAAAGDPPFVAPVGQVAGECVADAQGSVLRVTVLPTRFAGAIRQALRVGADGDPASWGLHSLDMDLMQGNLLERLGQEARAWVGRK